MSENFDIDDKTRFLVLYLDAKMDVHEISKIINRRERTVKAWEKRTKKGEDIRIFKKGRGRKKSITDETINKIIQSINDNPEGASLRKLAARMGVSHTSIKLILAQKGLKYKGFDNSIIYAEQERVMRVDFCKKMLSDNGKLIYRAFYSDEMGIELNKTHKTKTWQFITEKVRRKNATENVKLNCWGAISLQGATSLDIYDKSMNGDFYRQVIEHHKAEMENLYSGEEFYLIQDNHPAHRVNEDWMLKQQNVQLIKLPKRSPDLNIIENLWAALKERVASDAPTTEKELRASLLTNWEVLTRQERLQPFFEGLHRRYMECIAIEGEKLPY